MNIVALMAFVFVSQFGLVCDSYLLVSLSQTLVVLGQGIGAFVASVISDRSVGWSVSVLASVLVCVFVSGLDCVLVSGFVCNICRCVGFCVCQCLSLCVDQYFSLGVYQSVSLCVCQCVGQCAC